MTNFADLIPVTCPALRKEVADAECESYDLRKITRPCVYAFIKEGVPLYIGSSANAMFRFGSPDHLKPIHEHQQMKSWCSGLRM